VQCLYCETELKPLRGLFDEDFCCKEHREKYFSSFRKGINLLPVLDLPPLERKQEMGAEETAPEVMEDAPETAAVPDHLPEIADEPAAVKPTPAPVLAIAEELSEAEPIGETEVPELTAAAEPVTASASVEAVFDDSDVEGPIATPRSADFLHLHVTPFNAAECYFMVEEDSFSACNGPSIPNVEVFCDAEFEPEERVAHLLAPADMVAAGGVSGRATTPELQPAVVVAALSPSFHAWDYVTPSMPALEPAELIEDVEMFVAGDVAGATARCADIQPLAGPAASVTIPAFHAAAGEAQPPVAEAAELDLACQQIEAAPLMFSDIEPALEIQSPVFRASAAAMQLEEELKRAIEPPKTQAARLAEPEIARPAAMSAAPASRPVSTATFQPTMPAAAARPEAQLNVPAMTSRADAVPGLAPEATPDPPRGAAAEQPPSAHSSDPVQPAIQNSVRIKNWRLKITFAKPA
jgi:hypothetical protein